VKSESARYLKLLEKRLELLGSLAKALTASRNDFVSMDLGAIERGIQEQEQFCAQIRSLDAEITRVQLGCAERTSQRPCTDAISWPGSPDSYASRDEQIRVTMGRVAAAQAELKRLNDAHQAMLRRSRRTVQVLLNLFNSYAPTYSAPASAASGTTYEERA
jgi:flagellar FlgN protein